MPERLSKMYDPTLLPQVEKILILNLGGTLKGPVSNYLSLGELSIKPAFAFSIYATVEVEGEEASEIAELWRKLPHAEQIRCHVPPYGLRFYREGQMILEASVCWRCNNIWTRAENNESVYTFDSSAEISQRLLTRLHEIAARNPPATRRRLP